MTAKLTEQYDYKCRSWNQLYIKRTKYGVEGTYTHKDLGECSFFLTEYGNKRKVLMLDIWKDGYEYHRNFDCSEIPSDRLICKKAKEFLEEVINGN